MVFDLPTRRGQNGAERICKEEEETESLQQVHLHSPSESFEQVAVSRSCPGPQYNRVNRGHH